MPEATAVSVREQLSGKQSKTRTKSTARLSLEGRFVAAAATLLPIGAALFASDFKAHHRLVVTIGALLLAVPLLVALGFAAAKGIGILLGGRGQTGGRRRRLADLPTMSLFAREQQTDTFTEATESTEPTSVEFEGLFSQILQAAVSNHRRLVIVLDNIDRVDEETAKAVLSTMETFMGSSARSADARVWTLILMTLLA